jgi:hypothetical protein
MARILIGCLFVDVTVYFGGFVQYKTTFITFKVSIKYSGNTVLFAASAVLHSSLPLWGPRWVGGFAAAWTVTCSRLIE